MVVAVEDDDLSVSCICTLVGDEDLPVDVTRRIDDGVVVVVVVVEFDGDACRTILFELSRCESARNEKKKQYKEFIFAFKRTDW